MDIIQGRDPYMRMAAALRDLTATIRQLREDLQRQVIWLFLFYSFIFHPYSPVYLFILFFLAGEFILFLRFLFLHFVLPYFPYIVSVLLLSFLYSFLVLGYFHIYFFLLGGLVAQQ